MKQRFSWFIALLALALLALGGCSRDPEKVKRRYVENGDKYYAQGKYKEAVIMYKNAVKQDPRYGEAYNKLGDAELRRGEVRGAVGAYRRAVELMPKDDDAAGKLADIYLAAYTMQRQKNDFLINEVRDLSDTLLRANPKSYNGVRLKAFVALSKHEVKESVELFRQADAIRPKQPELRFALAMVLNQDKRWEESEAMAKTIMDDSPAYVSSYDFLVVEYLRRNKVAEAEAVLKRKVAANPQVIEFQLQQAGFYLGTQRREQGEQILRAVLAQESRDRDARRKVGEFYARLRNLDEAYRIFKDGADKYADQKTQYRIRMAQVLIAQGKSQEALALTETAVKDDPKSTDALSLRASLQLQYGGKDKVQGAINDLQSLVARTPQNAVVRFNLGRAYQVRGELDAARVQFNEAIKSAPSFVAAHVGLGQVELAKRDFGKAITAADEALKIDPRNTPARIIKANALTNSGNLRQARMELVDYLKQSPDSPDLQYQLAVVDFLDGQYKVAEESFRKLRAHYAGDPRLAYAIAEVMIRTKRQPEAVKFLQEELAKAPDNKDLRMSLAGTALAVGQTDLAEKEFRRVLELDPKNLQVHMRLAETLRRKGQMPGALDILKRGQQLAPNDPSINLQLAMTMDAAGMKRESLPLYEAVVKFDPQNAVALNNVAYMYAEQGRDLDQALTYATRAKQRVPTSDDISDTLGWVYVKKNLNDNAITLYKELILKQPKNPTYHYHMGVAMLQKGNKPAAQKSLQTALGLNPSKEELARIKEYLAKVG